ncbi:MAG: TonB-dependent receptor [Bacteroidota bacterium]|nr:TonB-dependent receptor [Bacteroidota bacterium]MDP4190877.1 TonB-dependent receptor [Bacteroidota bacterium]MDP4195151.1 TonB-dependent receptor [Bacteroidota bacterium]
MKKQFLFCTLALGMSLICSQVYGQEEKKKDNTQVVTAQSLSEKTNAEDMAEALKSVPGVYIREGAINIRDASSNKVLILIDGQRMNSAQSGEFDATTLPIDAIEKVEVLRGGNSARYGADAVGGVVNFITKKATEKSKMDLGLRATYGSFNSQYYNVYTSNALKDFNYYVSYKRNQSDGDFKYKEVDGKENTRINNKSEGNDVLVKLGYDNILPMSTLAFTTQYTQSKVGAPGSIKGEANWPSITPNAQLKQDNSMFNLNYNQQEVFGKADLEVNGYFHNFRTRYDDPDTWGGGTHSDHKNKAYGVELTQNNPLSDLFTLTYGYTYRHDNANSTDLGDKDRNTHSAHAAVKVDFKKVNFFFDNISIVPAARYDAPSDFDKIVSPKISLMFSNSSQYAFNINAHASRSYRAPTFNDLYWPFDGYTVGNPNLKPEKGTSIEAGYGITLPFLNNTQINMNYFYNELKDQIIWTPDDKFIWTPMNVDKSKTSGLETFIRTKFLQDMLSLEFNHTYMDARDKSGKTNNDKILIYRPYHKADINTSFNYELFSVNVNYQYMSKRFVDAANLHSLADVSLWNVNFGYSPVIANLKWSVRFDINNLFDKSYRLSDGYPMPGRQFRVTLGMSLH